MIVLQNHSLEVPGGICWQSCQNQTYPTRCQWLMMELKGIINFRICVFIYILSVCRIIESGEEVVMRTRIPRYVNPMVCIKHIYVIQFL